jgi:nucleoid-associated protein YgaU
VADDDKVGQTSDEINPSVPEATGPQAAEPVGHTVETVQAGQKPTAATPRPESNPTAAVTAAQETEPETEGPETPAARTGAAQNVMDARTDIQAGGAAIEASDTMATLRGAQSDWAQIETQMEGAVNDALTVWGNMSSAITSFLAPVPAFLLVFPSSKVPIPVPIPVMYKPETLKFSKEAGWSDDHKRNKEKRIRKNGTKMPLHDVPQVYYGGGGPEELEFELFFDTTDTQVDVRLHTKPIQLLVYRVPFLQQPPLVMFSWGMMLSKMSYVEDLEINYEMFRADGTPLRATVSLTLTEFDMGFLSLLPMNPTSYSEARKTWQVIEGQTLDWIAYQEYGDAAQWRHIAQVNNLDNPRDLRPGQILKLTPLA